MMSDEEDLMVAFEQAFANDVAMKVAAKPKNRKAAEKRQALRHDDGRRKRATGRTAQFNLKIRPEYKTRMLEAAKAHNRLLAEMAEEAFELYLSKLSKKGKAK